MSVFWTERWLPAIKPTVAPKTYELWEGHVRLHLVPTFGHLKLGDLRRPEPIQRGYARLLACACKGGAHAENCARRSPRTVQVCHTVMSVSLARAVEWGVLGWNPARAVDPPRHVPRKPVPWTLDQALGFLDYLDGTRWAALFHLLIFAGMRRGEVVPLRWSELDLDDAAVTVLRKAIRVGKELLVEERAKTDAGVRVLPLTAETVELLRRHRREILPAFRAAATEWREEGLAFPAPTGGVMEPFRVNEFLTRACVALGIPHMWPHALRHTFNHLLAREKVPAKVAQKLMGHASIELTLGPYGHVLGGEERAAAAALDEAISRAKHARRTRRARADA